MLKVPRVYAEGPRCVKFIAIPAKVPEHESKTFSDPPDNPHPNPRQ